MIDSPALRKARGAFFTPPEISRFLTAWAVRSQNDTILEPSCGEASFLIEAGERLRSLGASKLFWCDQLHGVEIHTMSAKAAAEMLGERHFDATIKVADFFDLPPSPIYDAVTGNPPFIRYQQFAGEARAKGLQAALAQGVRLTGLSNSWAAFVVHAAQFLRPAGRLALVLPAELLSVNYAAQVRRFLLQRFAKVRLVMFESRVFPDVLEEVILLMAEGSGGAPKFEVYQARTLEDLTKLDTEAWVGFTPKGDSKWTPALLSASAFSIYQTITTGPGFCQQIEWGETYLGAVTGNNDYFTLTKAKARELGLRQSELLKISPPGSRHLRGLRFSPAAWGGLETDGARCYLFYPGDKPGAAATDYIEAGRRKKVQNAYKCSNRTPWWRVPIVEVPDLLFTYMDHERPRLVANEAGVHLLNSLYGVSLKWSRKTIGRDLLPIASLNSVTLLGAEMVGRAYGGGLLKLEPKEADLLPLPSLATLHAAGDDLRALRPQLSVALRQGDLSTAVKMVDRVLLQDHLSIEDDELDALRQARELLFQRRISRSKGERGED